MRMHSWLGVMLALGVTACGDSHRRPAAGVPEAGSAGEAASAGEAGHAGHAGDTGNAGATSFVADSGANEDAAVMQDAQRPEIELPTIVPGCFVRLGDSTAPFVTDVILDCGEAASATAGVRVATNGEEAVLATTVRGQAVVLRASGTEGELELLPPELAGKPVRIATRPDGEPLLLGDSSTYAADQLHETGALTFLRREGGTWVSEVVFDREGWLEPSGFEIAADGMAHAWFPNDTPAFRHARRAETGEWVYDDLAHPTFDPWLRWTLDRTGAPVAFSSTPEGHAYQLSAQSGETTTPLGQPAINFGRFRMLRPAVPAAPEGAPLTAALVHYDEGLAVTWPDGAGGDLDRVVPDSAYVEATCSAYAEGDACSAPCEETYDSVMLDEFALAQTSDGDAWVVWLKTHVDASYRFERSCTTTSGPEPGPSVPPMEVCACITMVLRNHTTATLHVARFDFASGELIEVVALPVAPIQYSSSDEHIREALMIDAYAFDDQVAIGLRLRAPKTGELIPHVYRLLQLDTSQL